MRMDSLRELYINELKDLLDAERQLIRALPKMQKAASHAELKQAFTTHERQTQEQAKRLERILGELGETKAKKCKGMQGLIEEGKELIEEKPDPDVLDAGLISKAQHVEHYEIAGYGTVRTYAQLLGFDEHARLLQKTLDEEGETDKLLTRLAEGSINIEAEMAGEDTETDAEFADVRPGRAASGSRSTGSRTGGTRTGTRGGGARAESTPSRPRSGSEESAR